MLAHDEAPHLCAQFLCMNGFLFFTPSNTTCAFSAINSSCPLGQELCECFAEKWQEKKRVQVCEQGRLI